MKDPGPASYALDCVAAYVGGRPAPPPPKAELYTRPAACFVSLKKRGELRGCIGTLTPTEPDLGRELARNAHGSAFHDPRFPPVTADELPDLTCSVDVLGRPEECELSDLDPAHYGVIVSSGWRRGVLLPDLPGVTDVARQVGIALQKAGISPNEPFAVQRFTVRRYVEGDATGRPAGAPECGEAAGDDDDPHEAAGRSAP